MPQWTASGQAYQPVPGRAVCSPGCSRCGLTHRSTLHAHGCGRAPTREHLNMVPHQAGDLGKAKEEERALLPCLKCWPPGHPLHLVLANGWQVLTCQGSVGSAGKWLASAWFGAWSCWRRKCWRIAGKCLVWCLVLLGVQLNFAYMFKHSYHTSKHPWCMYVFVSVSVCVSVSSLALSLSLLACEQPHGPR